MPAASRSRSQLPSASLQPVLLGLEGGATRSTVLVTNVQGEQLMFFELGPANLRLLSDRQLLWHLRAVAERMGPLADQVGSLCLGLAGTRTDADRQRLIRAASRLWPRVPCVATDDLRTALLTAPLDWKAIARVLLLSGTGSCSYGERTDGSRSAKVGGRGHVIGDRGSACDLGQRALRALMADFDHSGKWPEMGAYVLDALCLTDPEDLIPWSMEAGKTELASVATAIFSASEHKDPLALQLLEDTEKFLVEDAVTCAGRLAERAEKVQFVLNGGVLLKNPAFQKRLIRRLKDQWPEASVQALTRPSTWGAIAMAAEAWHEMNDQPESPSGKAARMPMVSRATPSPTVTAPPLSCLIGSPTEARNPQSLELDTMPLAQAISMMLMEDRKVPDAILTETESLVWVIEQVISAFKSGGHLFYIGAGTSGRLGVLDASECPPTFRAPREQVQGLIAGGQRALWSAVEGAEDDFPAGAEAIQSRHVGRKDVVIGLAASGRTPFVWGGLAEAKKRGATTALIAFNPQIKDAAPSGIADRIIAPDAGPEVLTGSTRLKAGTGTKLILNLITTLAMSRCGKVMSNLMIDLNPSNVKLRDRAVRIVTELTTAAPDQARLALEKHGWVVKTTVEALRS